MKIGYMLKFFELERKTIPENFRVCSIINPRLLLNLHSNFYNHPQEVFIDFYQNLEMIDLKKIEPLKKEEMIQIVGISQKENESFDLSYKIFHFIWGNLLFKSFSEVYPSKFSSKVFHFIKIPNGIGFGHNTLIWFTSPEMLIKNLELALNVAKFTNEEKKQLLEAITQNNLEKVLKLLKIKIADYQELMKFYKKTFENLKKRNSVSLLKTSLDEWKAYYFRLKGVIKCS